MCLRGAARNSFADTGASRSTNARNKLLCDDAGNDAVVVSVAVFCPRRCCCWRVLMFVEFSLGKEGLDSKNIEHCFFVVCWMLALVTDSELRACMQNTSCIGCQRCATKVSEDGLLLKRL